jgi:arylsulfatase A-like enzyme/Tfp pilus assembly protein PilF
MSTTDLRPRAARVARPLLWAALLAAAAASSCARQELAPDRSGELNVLVITLDTIRADRLGAYGNDRISTPFVDGLAERGVLFERCVAPTPLTLPSHTSIFTGTYPVFHGVRDNGNYVVPGELTTTAEMLEAAGYRTGAFVGAFVLSSRWGLDQGFGTYTEPKGGFDPGLVSFAQIQRRADEVVDDAIAWLEAEPQQPFFAWVHLYDPHLPYDPPPDFAREYPGEPYLGEVAFSDRELGRLGAFLEASGLESKTLIIFAGDHGEGLGDHGEQDHGLLLYQTTARAPLIIAHPQARERGVRREEVVSLADIHPTIADALGLPLADEVQGRSLWPLLGGAGSFDERPVYAETYYPQLHFGWSPLTAIQDRRHQYIHSSEPELYDLERDPEQTADIFESSSGLAERMAGELRALEEELGRGSLDASSAPDADTIAKLAALGYVAGGVEAGGGQSIDELPSPKSMLWLYNRLIEANNAMAAGDERTAETMLREIVAANEKLVDGWVSLGKLYRRQGRMAEAAAVFRKAHEQRPLDPFLVSRFATALMSAQQPAEAEQLLLAALEQHPDDPYIVFAHGRLLEKTGRFAEAEVVYRRSVQLDPRSAPAHVRLAALALQRGDAATVEAELEAAVRLDPGVPEASMVRGQLMEAQGRLEEAARAYREELERTPRDLSAALSLSRVEGRLGRKAEQEAALRHAIEANPRSPGPYLMLALTFLQREERYEEARRLAELGLQQQPQGQELKLAYFLLADLSNRLGDREREAEYFRLGSQIPGPGEGGR